MKYKLAIFDLDGTVLNTIGGLAHAVNEVRKMNGLEPQSSEMVASMIGNGTRNLIKRSLKLDNREDLEEKFFQDYSKFYTENCNYDTFPYDGIKEMLIKLNEAGIKCAVVTNKPDKPAKILIKEHFDGLIKEVHGNVPGIPVKPDPTFVFETMKNQGVLPEETVYIGDSEVDIKTAHAAGIKPISVDWGFKTHEFLQENGAEVICSDPDSLLSLIIVD